MTIFGLNHRCYKELKKTQKKKNTGYEEYMYNKFEDFVFLQKAPIKFNFEAHSARNSAGLTNLETEQDEQLCLRLVS